MQLRSLFVSVVSAGSLALLGAALLPACGDDSSSNAPDSGTATEAGTPANLLCAPGSRSCKSDAIAQVCSTDGLSQTDQPCGVSERCTGGSCVSGTNPNVCQDATTALRRLPTGAFEVVKCPAGTACTGAGLCKGAFVVGSAECQGFQTVVTSADGLTQVSTACTAGQLCVATGDVNGVTTAACKASECIPTTPNLAFCGNPKNPTANVGKAVSKCVPTPEGYKFVTSLCVGNSSCIPGAIPNNNNVSVPTDATCASGCVPGTSRCSGNGITTCAADGTWTPVVAACALNQACLPSPTDPSKAICGDAACAHSVGACDGVNFRACSATATLGAAAPCALGACVADGLGGGICITECTAGEEQCVGNGSTAFQTCVNGRWSATATSCPAAAACVTNIQAGKSAKLCGAECVPGAMRCTLADGGVGDGATETCSAAGKWGAPTACAVGRCQTNGNSAACIADCVPNSLVCVDGGNNVPGTPYNGQTGFKTCSAKGLFGDTTTDCAADTFCRSKNGRAIAPAGATNACTTCIGSNIAGGNEDGLVDSRCSTAAGDALGGAGSQICGAANTWTAGVTACANGCTGPAPHQGPLVPTCGTNERGNLRTETYFANRRRGSCVNQKHSSAPAIVCGVTPDCCGNACNQPIPAKPASCNAAGAINPL